MYFRVSVVALFLVLSCAVEARLSFSSVQGQIFFLDELQKEMEEKASKQKGNKTSEDEDAELLAYKADILKMRTTLYSIQKETEKQTADTKVLQELVDEYNKKMRELKEKYKFILEKARKLNLQDENLISNSSGGVLTIDSLSYEKKSRRIKDSKFRPLEIVEVSSRTGSNDRSPIEEKKE